MEQKQEESAALAKQTDEDIFAVTLKEVLIVFSSKKTLITSLINNQIFKNKTSKEITAKCWGIIISQPFHGMNYFCLIKIISVLKFFAIHQKFHSFE